ncbi:VUT family protein [Loktanella sp. IMCC34160]|uniref:queuosine precursor transporter n=1 Tax=Loktanella sp. IMCC34160 TaxID=2510646 RepID=UPI00101D03DF|nr:queuosine precursor transporter [Loktanella sp. IMCC34160]RYG91168.1 VUT family protein [Loktanella sp. IMCC34160]
MTRILPGILAMAAIVVASNILVQFFVGDWLTWGAFTYPFAFLVTDVMNRVYGAASARKVVFAGFIVGLICSYIGTFVMIDLAPDFSAPAVTTRIAIGSGTAFLVAQLVDVFVFDRLRSGAWWRAPLASTLIGSTLDTILFFSLAFSAGFVGILGADHNTDFFNEVVATPFGFDATRWVGTAVVDWSVKLGIALIALIPFRIIVGRMLQRLG